VSLERSESTTGLVQCNLLPRRCRAPAVAPRLPRRCRAAADAVWSAAVWLGVIGGGEKGAKLNTAFKGFGPLYRQIRSRNSTRGRLLLRSRTKQVPHYAKRGAAPVIGRAAKRAKKKDGVRKPTPLCTMHRQ
jgi:hypothetical protein